MEEDYGREEWQKDEAAARTEAIRRIHAARDSGADTLDFSDLTALTALPIELEECPLVTKLYVGVFSPQRKNLTEFHPRMSDISNICYLRELELFDAYACNELSLFPTSGLPVKIDHLNLNSTSVSDLRPLSNSLKLRSVDLTRCPVTDISPLSTCPELHTLVIDITPIIDLNALLSFSNFANEQGGALRYSGAAIADLNRHFYHLSRLPPVACATETIQYLKGTHPIFHNPPGGKAPAPLAARLAAASPVDIRRIGDVLEAVNPGRPERVNRLETGQRIEGLRKQVALVAAEAGHSQCPPAVLRRLTAYAGGLQADPPVWFVIDSALDMVRGSLDDAYLTEAMDKGLQAGFRGLFKAHDGLRPFLMPPSDAEAAALDALPDLRPDVTAREVRDLAREAVEIITAPDTREAIGAQAVQTLKALETMAAAFTETAQAAKGRIEDRPGFLRRVVAPFGGTLSVLADAVTLHGWWLGPTATALAARLQPLLDKVLALFA